jgi:hypothetical protein
MMKHLSKFNPLDRLAAIGSAQRAASKKSVNFHSQLNESEDSGAVKSDLSQNAGS